jgi:hypothetical protein
MTSRTQRTAIALAAAATLALPAVALGQTDKERELEARVSELEKIVKQLLAEKQAAGAAPAAAVAAPAPAKTGPPPIQETSVVPNALAGTRFFLTGFAKLDALYTQSRDGLMASGAARDFYVPAATPVGGDDSFDHFQAHVKQTRVMLGTDSMVNDQKLGMRLEFDLYGSALGDERITNTYGLQVRHAYATWGKWLFGQNWSNFMDVGALPDTVDFIGNTDGTVFIRQAQVRWTSGGLSLSAENPNTTYTPALGTAGLNGSTRLVSDENNIPDLTLAYQWPVGKGYLRAALLGRQLRYETANAAGASTADDSIFTVAGAFTGKLVLGDRDDLRFTVYGGDGIGRYVGLNFQNDAVLDASGDLEAISGIAGSLSWRHAFSPQWRTNVIFAMQDYDIDTGLMLASTSKKSLSWALNAFYTPVPKLDLGLEFRFAERELENGTDGSMKRLQATAKYAF